MECLDNTGSPIVDPQAQFGTSSTIRKPYRYPNTTHYSCETCGKAYSTPHHLLLHTGSCNSSKRKVDDLLHESRVFWEMRKKRRVEKQLPAPEIEPNAHQALQRSPPARAQAMVQTQPLMDGPLSLALPSGVNHGRDLVNPQGQNSPAGPCTSTLPSPLHLRGIQSPGFRDESPEPVQVVESGEPSQSRTSTLNPSLAPLQQPKETRALALQRSSQNAFGVTWGYATPGPPQRPPNQQFDDVGQSLTLRRLHSSRSVFGVVREYTLPFSTRLTHEPDRVMLLEEDPESAHDPATTGKLSQKPTYGPFKSKAAFSLADWYWNSTNKSFLDFQKLITIFKDPDFSLTDAIDVNWRTAFRALGANEDDSRSEHAEWVTDDGWTSTPITIDVPFHKKMKGNKGTSQRFTFGQFRHRRILSVIKEKISDREDSSGFHYVPYRETWKTAEGSPEVELYGEMYASRAFRATHEEVQVLPSTEENRGLERVVLALMFWSDATHLATFSNAVLWPLYLFFGNESKNRRCQPTERLANHVTYFQKLPDTFYDYLKNLNDGKLPTDGLLAYCAREVYHQQWCILLDDELREAMRHGIPLLCPDGVVRCFYPRIFTYSADYPEKILLAGVRNNGICPCHRCLVSKKDLSKLGAPTDVERDAPRQESEIVDLVEKARREIIDNGFAVDSTSKVEVHLKHRSLVPSNNAFLKFAGHPFNIRDALVVDLMHEFEIGVWKKVFIHAVRLLEFYTTPTKTLTAALDERYRATPPFGRDSIRKFGPNVSDMKRKAARDFADLLQCAIPAFESLIPEPQSTALTELLYICAEWHALAKLRLHNDFTLAFLDYATKILGAYMRYFSQEVCSKIPTKELAKEAEARLRKEAKSAGKSVSKKSASLSVFTIKFHFLGDYVRTIRWFGTTDSYSTETGELAHRLPKSWYPRTDKRDFEDQMSQIERRQARLEKIRSDNTYEPPTRGEERIHLSPDGYYVIAKNQDSPLNVIDIAGRSDGGDEDMYTKGFISKLKQHLLPHILEKLGYQRNTLPDSEYYNVVLSGDRVYSHQLLRINYATYDLRRAEDVVHIDTPQCNIMFLNADYNKDTWGSCHPYLYAKCLGVYHANITFVGSLPDGTRRYDQHRIDFVWVHWYSFIPADRLYALDRLSLAHLGAPNAVDFRDPAEILRSVHVIPQFSLGEAAGHVRSKWVSSSAQTRPYTAYYLNRFADRDLFMRYQYGMSVGHTYMHGGKFPPPKIPTIPAGFDHWDGPGAAPEGGDEDNEEIEGPQEGVDYSPASEMDDREMAFYLEMYET